MNARFNDDGQGPVAPQASGPRIRLAYLLSAGFGGFLTGFGELLRVGDVSTNVTVLRIAAVLREQFSPALGAGWIALLLLAVFAMILCVIYQSGSTKESFAVGLSVFAIFTVTAPPQEPKGVLTQKTSTTSVFSLLPSAIAAENMQPADLADYYFAFKAESGEIAKRKGTMSVYDKGGRELLAAVDMDVAKVSRLQLPLGVYRLKFECQGCLTVRGELRVEKPAEASVVTLGNSSIPLSLQRLFSGAAVDIEDVPADELLGVVQRYKSQRQSP